MWDDNCWLQNIYATNTLQQFLDLGFAELRRVLLGTALYALFSFHESGPYFYIVWHTVDTITEIATPILLYLLVRNLFHDRRPLAFFIALCFIAFRFDHTLGYLSAINYRIGLLLGLLSFHLTERGLSSSPPRPLPLLGAILATGIACFMFIEPTVMLEPARLVLICYVLRGRVTDLKALFRRAVSIWSPFLLLAVLLVAYKLLDKPFGLYAGAYASPQALLKIIKIPVSLFYWEGIELFHALQYWNPWSLTLSLLAALLGFAALTRLSWCLPPSDRVTGPEPAAPFLDIVARYLRAEKPAFWLGLTFLLSPVPAFLFADRPLGGNMNSSHATLLQIGTSVLIGTLACSFYSALPSANTMARHAGIGLLACLLGLGTFVNNKYLDLFFQSWEEETRFWRIFTQRFPNLPERSVFFFDVDDGARFSDLRIYYDFEWHLNVQYAVSSQPEDFHRHSAYTMDEVVQDENAGIRRFLHHGPFERWAHFGPEVLDSRKFIVVRYRPGELLVNREILARYPDIAYKAWLDKDFPTLPPPSSYVLRHKLEGFQ
jgi:hypothetical protein